MFDLAMFNLNRISSLLTILCNEPRSFQILLCCQYVVSSLRHETIVGQITSCQLAMLTTESMLLLMLTARKFYIRVEVQPFGTEVLGQAFTEHCWYLSIWQRLSLWHTWSFHNPESFLESYLYQKPFPLGIGQYHAKNALTVADFLLIGINHFNTSGFATSLYKSESYYIGNLELETDQEFATAQANSIV
jgi:hypothetical protein